LSRRLRVAGCLLGLLLLVAGVQGAGGAPTELFFSEYIEGSSNNKALEVYNGTGAAVDLAAGAYNVQMYFNGNPTAGLTVNLTGTVADEDVYVLAHESANPAILAEADQTGGRRLVQRRRRGRPGAARRLSTSSARSASTPGRSGAAGSRARRTTPFGGSPRSRPATRRGAIRSTPPTSGTATPPTTRATSAVTRSRAAATRRREW
jgi:hypothetical protein